MIRRTFRGAVQEGGASVRSPALTTNPLPMVGARVLSGPRLAPATWTPQPTKPGRVGVGAQKPQSWVAELGSGHGLEAG